MKRILLGLCAVLIGLVVAPGVASAHQADLTLSCSAADAHMFLYPLDATYVLKVDGVNKSFAPNGTLHESLNPNVNHTASLHITPGSDGGGKFDKDLSVENCVPATTTQAPTTTAAATTTTVAATTTTQETTTSAPPSSSTTSTTSTSTTVPQSSSPSTTSTMPASSEPSNSSSTTPQSPPPTTACTEPPPSVSPTDEATSSVCAIGAVPTEDPTTSSTTSTASSTASLPSTGRDLTALIVIAAIVLIIGLAFRGPQVWKWWTTRRG